MNPEIIKHIQSGCSWKNLPETLKQVVKTAETYSKIVVEYSLCHQLCYKQSSVRFVVKDEKKYYEAVIEHSMEKLLLYPYHLQAKIVGLRITPFIYYINMMEKLMQEEKSYDSLPNFTAADALRLLGIGRNQYIEIMNLLHASCKQSFSFFRKILYPKDYLPKVSVKMQMESWWIVNVGYVTEDDIEKSSSGIKNAIDFLIDKGPSLAGCFDYEVLQQLYRRGLIFLHVPVEENDYVRVPPLDGFVMNRVSGDYLETLLYKVFISIDERTSIKDLACVLGISVSVAESAVSIFCRLGFAQKKTTNANMGISNKLHASWQKQCLLMDTGASPRTSRNLVNKSASGSLNNAMRVFEKQLIELGIKSNADFLTNSSSLSCTPGNRVSFLFDSSLTAFLMMGNLSSGLKNHAVTLFEVGKLTDESLDSFLAELKQVKKLEGYHGDAQRYFEHAINLRTTILCLRHNKKFSHLTKANVKQDEGNCQSLGIGLDLLRCESLGELDGEALGRLLEKKYCLVIAMAPLSEIQDIPSTSDFFFIGPPSKDVNSVWFKLYLYDLVGNGPPTLFLPRKTKLSILPSVFMDYKKLLITSIGHEPLEVNVINVLVMLNEALLHSAVLVQGFQRLGLDTFIAHIPFPVKNNQCTCICSMQNSSKPSDFVSVHNNDKCFKNLCNHVIVKKLSEKLDFFYTCGYISFLISKTEKKNQEKGFSSEIVELLSINFGIPIFDDQLNQEVCELLLQIDFSANGLLNLKSFNDKLKRNVAMFIKRNKICQQSKEPKESLLFSERSTRPWNKYS